MKWNLSGNIYPNKTISNKRINRMIVIVKTQLSYKNIFKQKIIAKLIFVLVCIQTSGGCNKKIAHQWPGCALTHYGKGVKVTPLDERTEN
jgi:hypothetical protein